ncbi:MAG TPA: phosphoesterase [Sulfurovum sp.]|nr:phosphoesterase [Sulfurovum sp.]
MTKLYHLSHIDLDGYGCQYLTLKYFEQASCYNANYGPEVKARLEELIVQIERDKFLDSKLEPLILITDLNLTTKEGNQIAKEATRVGATLQLLDHHATGASAAERFDWYELDTSRCATLITYDWLREKYGFDKAGELGDIVSAINAVDIWLSDHELFEYGKVMLGMISGAREINRVMFADIDRAFKLSLIEASKERLDTVDAPIVLDDDLHQIKKSFFKNEINNTKDNLVAYYVTELLTKDRPRLEINYMGYKGMLGYNVGSASIIGNTVLLNNPDIDFYMDVNYRGNFSLRSNDKTDVSKMAAHIGNGGGHPNASGGKIKDYKDSFVYADVRKFVQNYINEKSMK